MECVILLIRLLAGGLGCLAALWGGYYLVVGLMSWRCPVDCGAHPSKTRFAVLIAARNEEMVIGPLIQSLVAQNYPRELYHIWVIPNNCTDDTAGEARRWGAHVLNCTIPVKNKGEVLRFAYGVLAHKGYDAFCVFDADNLVHPDFLQEMNNAYLCGARAAQGYRDSKNPYDTVTSGCCSIYYWMMDRFHNGGHAALGLPAMINGTGFMIATSALEEMGGWSTRTISEDLELSALCTMAGIRVWWVPKARTFDEQPLSFAQSVRQRRRWSSGTLQVGERFLPRVWAEGTRQPSLPLADLGMTLLIPAYQLAMLASAGAEAVNAFMREDYHRGCFGLLCCGAGDGSADDRSGLGAGSGSCDLRGREMGQEADKSSAAVLGVPTQLASYYGVQFLEKDHCVGRDPPYPQDCSGRAAIRKVKRTVRSETYVPFSLNWFKVGKGRRGKETKTGIDK